MACLLNLCINMQYSRDAVTLIYLHASSANLIILLILYSMAWWNSLISASFVVGSVSNLSLLIKKKKKKNELAKGK